MQTYYCYPFNHAVAKQIVDLHGGSVSVLSVGEEGKGSTFTVRLPGLVPIDGTNDNEAALASNHNGEYRRRNDDPSPNPPMSELLPPSNQAAPPAVCLSSIPPFNSTTVELRTERKVRLASLLQIRIVKSNPYIYMCLSEAACPCCRRLEHDP